VDWNDVQDPYDLNQWGREKAATPQALERFWGCMHHVVDHIETVINDSKLEHPLVFETGVSEVTFHDGRKMHCYVATFKLVDTQEVFDYLFEMQPDTDKYVDARYADPSIPTTTNKIQ
jgi:hypothetical protein